MQMYSIALAILQKRQNENIWGQRLFQYSSPTVVQPTGCKQPY